MSVASQLGFAVADMSCQVPAAKAVLGSASFGGCLSVQPEGRIVHGFS